MTRIRERRRGRPVAQVVQAAVLVTQAPVAAAVAPDPETRKKQQRKRSLQTKKKLRKRMTPRRRRRRKAPQPRNLRESVLHHLRQLRRDLPPHRQGRGSQPLLLQPRNGQEPRNQQRFTLEGLQEMSSR